MRIGVDACCWSNKRGFGRFTIELLNALIAFDQNNEYFFFLDKDTALTNVFPERVKIVIAPTQVSPIKAASASGHRSIGDLLAMSRSVLRYHLDLFFFPAVYTYYPILNRTRIVVTIHDMTPKLYPEKIFPNKRLRLFWSLKEYLAVWQAKLILTVSENSKQDIMRFYKISERRVSTISEGPNTVFQVLSHNGQLAQVLHRYQLNPSDRFLLYVGGISPHKNLRTLIEVHKKLTSDPSFSEIKLILVGDYQHDSFYSDYFNLKKLINTLHLEEKVIFTGYIQDRDLAILYNTALLLIFPSLQEGFGLPAVEAMACGTPVAASNTGSLPEILDEAGRFFDPHSPTDMLRVIKDILTDEAMREKMSRCGMKRAKLFSWDRSAKDLLSIFENLVKD